MLKREKFNEIKALGLIDSQDQFENWTLNENLEVLIDFYSVLTEKQLDKIRTSEERLRNIQYITSTLKNHPQPEEYIKAIILINGRTKFHNQALTLELLNTLSHHPSPEKFAINFVHKQQNTSPRQRTNSLFATDSKDFEEINVDLSNPKYSHK